MVKPSNCCSFPHSAIEKNYSVINSDSRSIVALNFASFWHPLPEGKIRLFGCQTLSTVAPQPKPVSAPSFLPTASATGSASKSSSMLQSRTTGDTFSRCVFSHWCGGIHKRAVKSQTFRQPSAWWRLKSLREWEGKLAKVACPYRPCP